MVYQCCASHTISNTLTSAVAVRPGAADLVGFADATFAWSPEEPPLLHSISMNIREGRLVVVVGPVGSGKSSMLAALLGEMHAVSGKVALPRTVAYTAQVGDMGWW